MTARVDWSAVLTAAARIVDSYDTGVTLRQLFYRLIAAGRIPNTQSAYVMLSSRTAAARRDGRFPALIDRGREIHRYETWTSPRDALDQLVDGYRRDRTEGQPCSIYLGVEKATMAAQLIAWFGGYGFPVVPLGGYSSQPSSTASRLTYQHPAARRC